MYISKIKVGNIVYDIKDSVAQSEYIGTRITLESAPTSSTLTSGSYTFKIGDEVRVLDASKGDSSTNNYVYYKLYDLVNNYAYWGVAGTGSGEAVSGTATISINLSVNGVSTSRTTESPVITLTNTNDSSDTFSDTWTGNNLTFSGLTPYSTYTVVVGNISGYDTPSISDIVIGIGTSVSRTATYTAYEYTLNIDSDQTNKTPISGAQMIVTDGTLTKTFTYGSSDNKFRFPTANTVSVSSSTDVSNYNKTVTVSAENKTISLMYTETVDGVFAVTTSGDLVAYSNIDTNSQSSYVGVAIIDSTNDFSFFIDKRFPTGSEAGTTVGNYKAWSAALYNTDQSYLTNIGTAYGDGNSIASAAPTATREAALAAYANGETGIVNTNYLVADTTASSETAANNAAKYCRSIANPVTGAYDGYLGSLAEWIAVNDNQVEVNQILTAIGGVAFASTNSGYSSSGTTYTRYWTSSEYSSSYAWYWSWSSFYSFATFGNFNKSNGLQYRCARPFFPLS